MLVLSDSTLAVGYSNAIQIIDATDYKKWSKRFEP
jgi:hypothetical protein